MDETVKKAQPEIRRNSERLDDLEAHQANIVKNLDDTSNQVQDNVKEIASLKQMTGNQNNNLGDIEDRLKQSEDQIKHIDDTIDGVHKTVAIKTISEITFCKHLNLWTCLGCDRRSKDRLAPATQDTQAHVLSCVGYADLRMDKDLSDDKDLVEYFSAVIKRRINESA